jgi:hypothetical protein
MDAPNGKAAAEEWWREFKDKHVSYPWFDDDRVKTIKAMRTLWDRMPEKDKERIPDVIVFAPTPDVWGRAYTWYQPANCPIERRVRFIYLSPAMESRPRRYVNATVAHEFAHAIFGHEDAQPSDDLVKQDREADNLIQEWGYRPTNSGGWMRKGRKL